MDEINTKILSKQKTIESHYKKIDALKKEIIDLEEKKYLMCDHKFQLYPVYSGPYPERSFICTQCGYEITNIV